MGGEWLFCDGNQNENISSNDHKIRTTLSPHVSFSPHSFVTRQKNGPSETNRYRSQPRVPSEGKCWVCFVFLQWERCLAAIMPPQCFVTQLA